MVLEFSIVVVFKFLVLRFCIYEVGSLFIELSVMKIVVYCKIILLLIGVFCFVKVDMICK